MADHEDYLPGEAPAAHADTHENGGADEISVAGLSGLTEELVLHAANAVAHQNAPALIAAHAAIAGAHHARYTDVEAQAIADAQILIHKGDASAHHIRYADAEAQAVADARIAIHAALPTVHQDAPALIATHAALPTVHQDAPALILAHKGDAAAHHARYTSAEARAAINDIFGADGKMDSNIDADGHRFTNLLDPVSNHDVATKAWVLANVGGGGPGPCVLFPWLYDSIGSGSWAPGVDPGMMFNYFFQNTSLEDGDDFRIKCFLSAGTYTLKTIYERGGGKAIIDIYIDADEVHSIDMYGAAQKNTLDVEYNIVVASSGVKTIKFLVDGKNASSSNYYCTLNLITFSRTA